jgi:coniferyl-aldehyde dehydrogenase
MKEITTIAELESRLVAQKKYFNQNINPNYQARVNDLTLLKKILLDNQEKFITALSLDFGHRSADDSKIGDILTSISSINYTLKRMKRWIKPQRKHIGILFQPAKGQVLSQPKGVIGIVTPWNYPLFLSIGPLTAAIAAGNVAMIKMSEYSPNTCGLLAKLIGENFSEDKIAIVGGDVGVAAKFSSLTFDHLFFTGSTAVGKLVMKSAALNLVPVTLELGGKSPAIIDSTMDISTAVSRFILGKTLNSGQTCVAPDYIFCPREKCDQLIKEVAAQYNKMYPNLEDNIDCTSIINEDQFSRLNHLLSDAKNKGANVIPCIEKMPTSDKQSSLRKLPLTLISNTQDDMLVMQQEIFGPILPIIAYDDITEVLNYINSRPRPLALYIYSFNKSFQQHLLTNTHSGGVCINEASLHVANDDLPFGGIGASGMGQYHGEEGFKTFSHQKAVFTRGRINFTTMLFPPFNTIIHRLVYKFFIR